MTREELTAKLLADQSHESILAESFGMERKSIISQNGTTGSTRRYFCEACGVQLCTESAVWRPTVRCTKTVKEHVTDHMNRLKHDLGIS
jgi:hypothetical protein